MFDRPVIGDTKPQNVLIAVAVGGAVEGFIQQMADCYGLSVGVQWRPPVVDLWRRADVENQLPQGCAVGICRCVCEQIAEMPDSMPAAVSDCAAG